MTENAVHVKGLSKRYKLASARQPYKTMRESIMTAVRSPFGRSTKSKDATAANTFWALKDVNFEVKKGEVVGIVGRNGAGKSTLLKILSRITDPTEGEIEITGRVGSLLEVGTGFHQELTGRENIYLNGAILGMKRGEISRKFDEIVEFAETEKFLDTPVKYYSSGMYMRLAFAVAVNLEPEILVVDEVLAVGDAQFQKKCFEKMQDVSKGGKTILFVSHNLAALRQICTAAIALSKGRVVDSGEVNGVVDRYMMRELQPAAGDETVQTENFVVNGVQAFGDNHSVVKTFENFNVLVSLTLRVNVKELNVYFGFLTMDNQRVAGLDLADFATPPQVYAGQNVKVGFNIDNLPLLPGRYQIELHLKDSATGKVDFLPRTFPFDVVETPVYGGRKLEQWFGLVGLHAKPVIEVGVR